MATRMLLIISWRSSILSCNGGPAEYLSRICLSTVDFPASPIPVNRIVSSSYVFGRLVSIQMVPTSPNKRIFTLLCARRLSAFSLRSISALRRASRVGPPPNRDLNKPMEAFLYQVSLYLSPDPAVVRTDASSRVEELTDSLYAAAEAYTGLDRRRISLLSCSVVYCSECHSSWLKTGKESTDIFDT